MSSRKKTPTTTASTDSITREQVNAFLRQNPGFLKEHPELYQILLPPEADHGNGVVDFQQHMLGSLQKDHRELREKFEELVKAARDNQSTQSQVHAAALRLVEASDLERLVELITQDLAALFGVDIVRLAVESDVAQFYDSYYTEQNYSGISFVESGTIETALENQAIRLCEDAQKTPVHAMDKIFLDCSGLVRSCALLRLDLPMNQRVALLAFGVREAGRFHAGQGTEMLNFLAKVVERQLDKCLSAQTH